MLSIVSPELSWDNLKCLHHQGFKCVESQGLTEQSKRQYGREDLSHWKAFRPKTIVKQQRQLSRTLPEVVSWSTLWSPKSQALISVCDVPDAWLLVVTSARLSRQLSFFWRFTQQCLCIWSCLPWASPLFLPRLETLKTSTESLSRAPGTAVPWTYICYCSSFSACRYLFLLPY